MNRLAAAASSVVAALILVACGARDEAPRGCGLEGTTPLPDASAELLYACSPEPNSRYRLDILVVRPGEPARLLTHGEGVNYRPSWSPDGRHIAFVSTRSGATELHVMNADGTGVLQITDSQAFVPNVNWSPDGARIVFASTAAGITGPLGVSRVPSDIYLARGDGSEARRLTLDGGYNAEPDWSPDGGRIAFTSDLGGTFQVWMMGSDGSGQRPLTSVGQNSAPDWSPDGSQIVFDSDRDHHGNDSIYLMGADGSGQRPLADDGIHPSWSPDGQWIVFESDRDGPNEIYAVHPDGSGLTQVTHDGASKDEPEWGPA